MADLDQWLAANDRFLGDALAWLRARLELLAKDEPAAAAQTPAAAPRWQFWRWRRRAAAAGEGVAAPAAAAPPFMAPANGAHPPALLLLGDRLGLSEFERKLLLLCAAMELDTRTASLCARAQRDPGKPYPTFALALMLFEQPAWDVLSPERPLRFWRLLDISQPGAQALTASALRADERIVNYIKGLNYLDDRLTAILTPLAPADEGAELPPSQRQAADAIARATGPGSGGQALPAIALLGADSASKRLVAQRVAAGHGLTLYRLAAEALPGAGAELETFTRLWQRESALLPIGLYLDASDIDKGDAQAAAARRWLGRSGALVFVDAREAWPGVERSLVGFEIAKPTPAEQRAAWQALLGPAHEQALRLAGQFNFNLPAIGRIAKDALAQGPADTLAARLWDGCLLHARPTLDQLAQRIEAKATWTDLQLPAAAQTLLRQIADQVARRGTVYDDYGFRDRMNRGLGISVLFAGESGTGKTMAAEVIANALGLLLYRIDLSAVVSKYIGETEKNLRKLFDAAEDGGAILFFDEADALFGKRSEVKDSHDRYANIEINYLLQRMEAYQGMAILATNMKSALDSAFVRRLRFIVNFPFPGAPQRLAMWQRALPAPTPRADLNYDRLARLNLTGGSIQNVALNSAFLAARNGGAVTMPLVLEAARAEFTKLEKPINEADFRWLDASGAAHE